MNLYIGEPIEYNDMQGPCDNGFHVPLQSDMEGLMTIMSGLSFSESYGYIYSVNLKMPMCGFRRNTDGAVSSTLQGYYWTSSSNSTNSSYLYFNTVGNANILYNYRASGMSIRPFKNEFVTPVSGWTVINGTLGGAGIFWNQTDGLISITSNGSTGYTIADKNLGATVVYNNGDTLSEANCGKFYQRGNNNGFAYTGTITTSSTLVNAQNYGPGNYYSGTSFICPSASPRDWSSVQNDNLRGGVSQGTSTKSVEVQNIYIGEYVPEFATRGPAPDGFHVPLSSEWQGLKTIMDGLGLTTGTNWKISLHMPFAGERKYSSASIDNQGTYGRYWSSSPYSSDYATNARYLYLDGSSVNANYDLSSANGYAVRCFKNSYVSPNSSWTVVKGTLGSAGIFWNQSEGLISITNGTTGYTIMDKNLGATTVYNSKDTLTQANMGNIYQWGNNYGFPSTGSVSNTSSTQVNASTYGPGNYYESSTWITTNPRDSSNNANLRGGVSQGTSTKSVEVQNIYIGEKPYEGNELCFTANTANSTVSLVKTGSPTSVTFETSTDGRTWTTYTFDSTITLSNIGDKVYWRNTSETDTLLNSTYYNGNWYQFVMTGSIAASGDVNYLLNKDSTTTLSNYCYPRLFKECTSLTTPPKLPATTLAEGCYREMFYMCTNLTTLPSLDVTTLAMSCYERMFEWCTKIKLSTTQTGEYQTPYRIPTTGTGTTAIHSMYYMFNKTNGTFTGTPSINTTYYTSNTVV